MKINVKSDVLTAATHEGGPAYGNLTPLQNLRRSLLSCLLWEDGFYENGEDVAERIFSLALECDSCKVADLAIEARTKHNLRHAPLLLLLALAKTASGTSLLSETMPKVILRADELAELVAIYWKEGKKPLSAQMKKGLAKSIMNFGAYSIAKYNRDGVVRLRDVMFLTHPKPIGKEKEELFKNLADKTLKSPDTWEVALSGGADKEETFERLIKEGKLGYLALLRNLRNMYNSCVDPCIIEYGLKNAKGIEKVLPFRFVAAARAVPHLESMIDEAFIRRIGMVRPLHGRTVVLVDVSGSMEEQLSARSDMTRLDAASALASIISGDSVRVITFSNLSVEVPPRKGMAGVDAIQKSQPHGGTMLGEALDSINESIEYDRIIVITDEQSSDKFGGPKTRGYLINVASNKNGVGYGPWVHIDGFSERVLDYIYEIEAEIEEECMWDCVQTSTGQERADLEL